MPRVEAEAKIRGTASFVDDLAEPGMLHGAVLRSPHPRARLLSLDVSAARALPGVSVVATWQDIPGNRYTGQRHCRLAHARGRGRGDALRRGCHCPGCGGHSRQGARGPRPDPGALRGAGAAFLPAGGDGARRPVPAPERQRALKLLLDRGNARKALESAAHVVEERFTTQFTDHAFMEPESALGYPPDPEGVVLVRTGEQNVYDGRRYVAATLGLPVEKVRVVSAYVGGAFGGKEDQTVQHVAALLAWLSKRPVKCTLARAESTRVHVKRHAMTVDLRLGCDPAGRLVGLQAKIVADTGAYASLGGPVLHRAVTHAGGPYAYDDIEVRGVRRVYEQPARRCVPRVRRSPGHFCHRERARRPCRRRRGFHRGRFVTGTP